MITTIKQLIPLAIKKAIVQSSSYYKIKYAHARRHLTAYVHRDSTPLLIATGLHNVLPNSGPVPIVQKFSSAREVIEQYPDATHRQQDIQGFDGFAVDDAVFDPATQQAEMWSYAPLAATIAKFAYTHYNRPTLLDLGCGPAHLFYFFRDLGLPNYIGMDGNPLFTKFNPHLAGFESHFICLNLQEEIQLDQNNQPMKFDIVYTFEVFEHIREDKVDNLIRTIRNHMHDQSIFFGTASLQSYFDVHVLVKDRLWWLQRFAQYDLVPHIDEARLIQAIGQNHPFNWNPQVSNIFAMEIRK